MAKRKNLKHMTMAAAASDEFDGTCLNEEKWTNGIWYDVTTDLAFHPENESERWKPRACSKKRGV